MNSTKNNFNGIIVYTILVTNLRINKISEKNKFYSDLGEKR